MLGERKAHGLKDSKKPSKLNHYKPQIDLSEGIFNCVVIHERLQELGYTGGITIIKEYVHPLRPARNSPAVRRYETPPGKQAQMNWGITHYIEENGAIHKTPVVDRKIELTPDRQIKLTHPMIKSPSRGGGKRGGKHVQMATHQSTACPGGQHQENSPDTRCIQEYRQEVP